MKTIHMLVLILAMAATAGRMQGQTTNLAKVTPLSDVIALFEPSNVAAQALPTSPPIGFTPVRTVTLDPDTLERLTPEKLVDVEPETALGRTWSISRVNIPAAHVRIVHATLVDDPAALAVFVTYDGVTAMSLRIPSQRAIYRLHSLGGNQYEVWRLDPVQLEPELCGRVSRTRPPGPPRVIVEGDDDWQQVDGPDPHGGDGPESPGGCGQTIAIIDTMVVYTPAARLAMGSHAAIRAEAALAVELTNVAYQSSLNSARARLVYCNEINYTETGNMNTDLDRLTNTDDGFMDNVHGLRDTVNADLVVLYQNIGSGLGWCPSAPEHGDGFSTAAWWRAAGTFTHGHETGHNLGCGHSREEEDGPCGPSWGLGWRFTGNDSNGYCTIMAYENETFTRILNFSNPNVSFMGQPTGNAIGTSMEAHNSWVVAANDGGVAGFEFTRFDVYVNFSWTFGENGTAAFPYNTLPEGVTAIASIPPGAAEFPNLYITAGTTTWTGSINKPMIIRSCSGVVRIGG